MDVELVPQLELGGISAKEFWLEISPWLCISIFWRQWENWVAASRMRFWIVARWPILILGIEMFHKWHQCLSFHLSSSFVITVPGLSSVCCAALLSLLVCQDLLLKEQISGNIVVTVQRSTHWVRLLLHPLQDLEEDCLHLDSVRAWLGIKCGIHDSVESGCAALCIMHHDAKKLKNWKERLWKDWSGAGKSFPQSGEQTQQAQILVMQGFGCLMAALCIHTNSLVIAAPLAHCIATKGSQGKAFLMLTGHCLMCHQEGDKVLVLSGGLDPEMKLHQGPCKVLSCDKASGRMHVQRRNCVKLIKMFAICTHILDVLERTHDTTLLESWWRLMTRIPDSSYG